MEAVHGQEIALGLERVRRVYERLPRLSCPVITVAGTNGKGSTVALLEAIYRAAGYRTGAYFSPHLVRYNERVRMDAREAEDEALCAAFARVEEARADVPLTYFEFGTLAALVMFAAARPDVVLLEVGLGGRLDAVNIVDADVSVVVSVGTDHKEWLGDDREAIGREKAGIFRRGRAAVIGFDVSQSVQTEARRLGAEAYQGGVDFRYRAEAHHWRYEGARGAWDLPYPALRGRYQLANAACALAAIECMPAGLPVAASALRAGLTDVRLPGRFQTLPGRPLVILDVAHNREAACVLAEGLREQAVSGRTLAVVGMLQDKPIAEVFAALCGSFDAWFLATLDGPRGAKAATLAAALPPASAPHAVYADPVAAFTAAQREAHAEDRLVVFGSFKTVGAILAHVAGARDGSGGRAL